MRYPIIVIMLLFALMPVQAALLKGNIYTETLQPAKQCILTINTTPTQRVLVIDGSYNLNVPIGTYHIAVMARNGATELSDEYTVKVIDNDEYKYDFILFPALNASNELPEGDELIVEVTPDKQKYVNISYVPAIILLVLLIIVALYASKRKWWAAKKATQTNDLPLRGDATIQQVIDILTNEGGRATQKELRKKLPYSEAKISMLLTDLEAKGKIQRIKKGRTNIIVLK